MIIPFYIDILLGSLVKEINILLYNLGRLINSILGLTDKEKEHMLVYIGGESDEDSAGKWGAADRDFRSPDSLNKRKAELVNSMLPPKRQTPPVGLAVDTRVRSPQELEHLGEVFVETKKDLEQLKKAIKLDEMLPESEKKNNAEVKPLLENYDGYFEPGMSIRESLLMIQKNLKSEVKTFKEILETEQPKPVIAEKVQKIEEAKPDILEKVQKMEEAKSNILEKVQKADEPKPDTAVKDSKTDNDKPDLPYKGMDLDANGEPIPYTSEKSVGKRKQTPGEFIDEIGATEMPSIFDDTD